MSVISQERIQVLHVDDEPEITDLTGSFLRREDDRFSIETATSADEGLQRISDRQPDCVVSDYDMPGTDGLEFLRRVRAEYPDLPFILFTGTGSEAVASDAISAGVTDYLQKQSGTEQYELLANRIQNAVNARWDAKEATRQHDLMRRVEVLGATGGWELTVESGDLRLTDGSKQIYDIEPGHDPSLEEVMGLYEPDAQQAIRSIIDDTIADGYSERENLNLRTATGEKRVVEANAELVETDDDSTVLRGVIRDITDSRKRQRELQEYETIIEALTDAVYVLDEDGRFTYINDEFVELVGYDRETILGNTPSLIKHTEAVEQAEHQLGRLLSSDGPETAAFEVTVHPREGEPLVCEDHMGVLPYDGEGFNGSVGTLRRARSGSTSTTGQHSSEFSLNNQPTPSLSAQDRSLPERILEAVPVSIVVVEPSGDIQFANKRAEGTLDLERDEITDRTYHRPDWDIYDADGKPVPVEEHPVTRVLETGESEYGFEHWIELDDGTERWLSSNASPVLNENGDVEYVTLGFEDATPLKSREDKLTNDKYRSLELRSEALFQPFVEAADGTVQVDVDEVVTLPDETALQYVTATGSSAKALGDAFDGQSAVLDVRLLSTTDEYSRFEIHVEPPTVPLIFDALGGTVSSFIRYEDETPVLIAELPGDVDSRTAIQDVKEVYPDVELVSQELSYTSRLIQRYR